jgi:glyoxylase-like metal-dependent hydrolase (beta-lactamase superfamily II)
MAGSDTYVWEVTMSAPLPLPTLRSADLHVLFSGYVGANVASTVTYVRDGAAHLIIDPGMVPSRDAILEPLAALGVTAEDISEVIFSHHHPDHTINAALFPRARFHDHWAIYQDDRWISRSADGYQVTPSVCLVATPGHTPQDVTTLVGTPTGLVACTHLWWAADGPVEDPLATDPAQLHLHRQRLLALPELHLIVPGHGTPFAPTATTPH